MKSSTQLCAFTLAALAAGATAISTNRPINKLATNFFMRVFSN